MVAKLSLQYLRRRRRKEAGTEGRNKNGIYFFLGSVLCVENSYSIADNSSPKRGWVAIMTTESYLLFSCLTCVSCHV